jgi:serine/threonine-protein kinase
MTSQGSSLIGQTLGRTYEILEQIGEGGMGGVYLGRHVRTGGRVAVKLLLREALLHAEAYRRFQEEARITSALRHPHIVQVMDFDESEDSRPYLVMEYLEGEDLERRMRQRGRLSVAELMPILRQVGAALQAAHESGVVHRDIKPQNIFLCRHKGLTASEEVAKVVDFGIAKVRHGASQMTRDMALLGTPHYMAPEAVSGAQREIDGRADQWALGVIAYRALSGQFPFDSDTMVGIFFRIVQAEPAALQGVPDGVALAISRALAKRPQDRFPSIAAMVSAMDEAAGRGTAQASRAKKGQARRALVLAGVGAALLTVSAGVWRGRLSPASRGTAAPGPKPPGSAPSGAVTARAEAAAGTSAPQTAAPSPASPGRRERAAPRAQGDGEGGHKVRSKRGAQARPGFTRLPWRL